MHFRFLKTILCPAIVLLSVTTACKKDKQVDTNSVSFKIAQSEKLLIPPEVDLPANLPGGNARVATYYAEGLQKYSAQIKNGGVPVTYEWVLNGPQADLYDATNRKVGTHGLGPFWQTSPNDSIFAQSSSPPRVFISPDSTSITWLLLVPKSGRVPTGIFADVTYIQRIATKGGKAPATPPASIHETASVPYTAIYRFTKKNP